MHARQAKQVTRDQAGKAGEEIETGVAGRRRPRQVEAGRGAGEARERRQARGRRGSVALARLALTCLACVRAACCGVPLGKQCVG